MEGVEALIFDVFGTVVNWRSSVEQELRALGDKYSITSTDWKDFAQEWRAGYLTNTKRIAAGGSGPSNVDQMHREILNSMLESPKWSHLGRIWGEPERQDLNNVWHRWPDTTDGLYALKKQVIIATLSNGNIRLLADMAKHADLPWDIIFSTELFDTYKPHPKAYLSAIRHISTQPEKCAMVAAHITDLRAAATHGMKTVYISRPEEEWGTAEAIKSKKDGGEVDVVVNSFVELASILSETKG